MPVRPSASSCRLRSPLEMLRMNCGGGREGELGGEGSLAGAPGCCRAQAAQWLRRARRGLQRHLHALRPVVQHSGLGGSQAPCPVAASLGAPLRSRGPAPGQSPPPPPPAHLHAQHDLRAAQLGQGLAGQHLERLPVARGGQRLRQHAR
jgi:hypothetical protein